MAKYKFKILFTLQPIERAVSILEKLGTVEIRPAIDRKALLKEIGEYDAILVSARIQFNEEFFKKAHHRLKIISRVGIGYDNIDLKAATKYGIMVTNTPGVMAESVAEHTILLMLAAAKNLALADREIREGRWEWERYRGTKLWCKTLGQIGLGRIGYLVAKKAKDAFNMRVLAYDPYVDEERILKVGGKSANLNTLLKESDIVSINAPLTEETHHLIGKQELDMMKRSAVIINTGRGPIIDEKALIDALQTGEIAKAGLDVFEAEPPKQGNPLLKMDNVVLTPHQASNTKAGVEGMFSQAAQNVLKALQGEKPKYLLNDEVYEKNKRKTS